MKTILIIEDEHPIRTNLIKLLQYKSFQAIGAEDGASGIQLAKAYLPDLIICDIMMPNIDGYGVLNALRQDPETVMIPFIFLSAKADRTDLRQGMNLGADDYLTKPFTSAELLEAISARLTKQEAVTQPYLQEMKQAANSLAKVAYCDPLTSLPNRIMLRHRLQESLMQAKRKQQRVAVLCLNLDRFRTVNTTWGHTVGDLLLQAVAERLTEQVGSEDTVARLSGDEFSIILVDQPALSDVLQAIETLRKSLSQPYVINDQEISVQVSMGGALYPDDDNDPDRLLTHADTARRWNKKQDSKELQFYSIEMDAVDAQQQMLEAELATAIERSEFQLYYQPQVNLIAGRIIGVECLVRWQHPVRGLVYPSTFIPTAEETGLIVPLGEWILRAACLQARAWQASNLIPLRVSVNLSARQFKQHNLCAVVDQVLQETGLDPKLLVLELTETSVMEDVEATIKTLHELKDRGIEISIDDFGTGYSSLNYLKRFPIDTLKIDQSFVSQVTEDPHDAAIATAIIAMAQSLNLKVLAEGVETQEQLAFLRKHGCHMIQGYLYSPPVPAEIIQQFLTEDKRLPSTIV